MKKVFVCCLMLGFLFMTVSCSNQSDAPTISPSEDSKYGSTFEELNLGVLLDYDFHLPKADERWVTLKVERYDQGEQASSPVNQLSYGESTENVTDSHLGFGIIRPESDQPSTFLYGPDASTGMTSIKKPSEAHLGASWETTIGEDDVELEMGETTRIAAYREAKDGVIKTIDWQDESAVDRMLKKEDMVLILTIQVDDQQPEET